MVQPKARLSGDSAGTIDDKKGKKGTGSGRDGQLHLRQAGL